MTMTHFKLSTLFLLMILSPALEDPLPGYM